MNIDCRQERTQDFFKGGGGLTFLNRAKIFATTQPAAEKAGGGGGKRTFFLK